MVWNVSGNKNLKKSSSINSPQLLLKKYFQLISWFMAQVSLVFPHLPISKDHCNNCFCLKNWGVRIFPVASHISATSCYLLGVPPSLFIIPSKLEYCNRAVNLFTPISLHLSHAPPNSDALKLKCWFNLCLLLLSFSFCMWTVELNIIGQQLHI